MPNFDIKKFLNNVFSIFGFNSEQSVQATKDVNNIIGTYFLSAMESKLTPEETQDLKNQTENKSLVDQQNMVVEVLKNKYSSEETRKIFVESANQAVIDYIERMSQKASSQQKQQILKLIEDSGL